MADPRSPKARGTSGNTAAKSAASEYEGGRDAPFSPVSEENSGNTPAVKEARRRADGSAAGGQDGSTGTTGTVNAPKAPESRGKSVSGRSARR